MTRAALTLVAALVAAPAAADPVPARGDYCAPDGDLISVDTIPGVPLGIDGLDCHRLRYWRRRVLARRCYSNGGSAAPQVLGFEILPDGAILHDGRVYRRTARRPVPGQPLCPL